MNPKIPLEIFLPPEDKWGHIHALVTNDHRGLNNGVFFLRVHEWSVWLMTATLGLEIYQPDVELEFGDQSAMGIWVKDVRNGCSSYKNRNKLLIKFLQERFRDNIMHVPQRWFNAYAGNRGETNGLFADPLSPQTKVHANSIKEGDLLVHHAGHKSLRAQRMTPWMDVAEQHLPQWELDLDETEYEQEIKEFWQNEAPKEKKRVDDMIKKEQNDKMKKQMKEAEAAKKIEDAKNVAQDKKGPGHEKQKDLERRGS